MAEHDDDLDHTDHEHDHAGHEHGEHEHGEHEHGEHEHAPDDAERREADAELEREARRLVALARIRQYGDPVLRMKARDVETYDADLRRLAERMTALMHEAQGVGLAATQVGVLRRLFVFAEDGEDRVIVNPVITARSDETEVDDEGCLSLREVLVPVERPCRVTIEGTDASGEPVRFELELPAARIVQHELDHLDGILIIDRTDEESRRGALARLRPQPVLGVR